MLGPRSRSEIDFLEKKVRKCSKLKESPPPFSYLRDITQFTNQGGGYMDLVVFGTFFWMQAISERLYGPSMPKIYFWKP